MAHRHTAETEQPTRRACLHHAAGLDRDPEASRPTPPTASAPQSHASACMVIRSWKISRRFPPNGCCLHSVMRCDLSGAVWPTSSSERCSCPSAEPPTSTPPGVRAGSLVAGELDPLSSPPGRGIKCAGDSGARCGTPPPATPDFGPKDPGGSPRHLHPRPLRHSLWRPVRPTPLASWANRNGTGASKWSATVSGDVVNTGQG